jgi:hypothetical protein
MSDRHAFASFMLRAFGPHVPLLPILALFWLTKTWHPSPLLRWLPSIFEMAPFVWMPVAWLASGFLLGHRVYIPIGWVAVLIPPLQRLYASASAWMTTGRGVANVGPGCFILIVAAGLIILAANCFVHAPVVFCLMNFVLLTVALLCQGSWTRFRTEVWPRLEAISGARAEVQSTYDEHAEELYEAFPPVTFKVEMRVRIPDTASIPDE